MLPATGWNSRSAIPNCIVSAAWLEPNPIKVDRLGL